MEATFNKVGYQTKERVVWELRNLLSLNRALLCKWSCVLLRK